MRVRFKSDQVTLEATDLKMSLALDLDAQTTGKADLVVSHRALAGFLRAARGPVTITHMSGEDHDRVRLSDGEIQVTLQLSIPPEDFPQPFKDLAPDGMRGTGAFTLSGAQALRLFDLGRSCVSREETRYYLNGTFLTTKPGAGTLRAVTTDGHRMAIIDCDEPARFIEGPRADGSKATDRPDGLIVPVRAVDLLIAIARKAGNAALTFHAGPRHLLVTAPGLRLAIQGIDGTYPDYTRVTPPTSDAFTAHLTSYFQSANYKSLSKGSKPTTDAIVKRSVRRTVTRTCAPFGESTLWRHVTLSKTHGPKPMRGSPYCRSCASMPSTWNGLNETRWKASKS